MPMTPANVQPAQPALSPAQRRTLRPRLRLSIRDASLTDLSLREDNSSRTPAHFWSLEPTPLVLTAEEWTPLEAGLRQRARLVNALLVDLYQRQQCLRAGILPPEAVLSDPFYRRPCLGLEPERANPATLLRFDLVRTPAGWRCVQTRSNTPIGLSYAVQNRRFMTQEAGDLYRALPDYHSVINFPLQLLHALRALAPRDRPSPSIVVLTAGPHDAFYSEHSFLARKMGLPLARGDDLLVLDNTVYFKTVAGLERVDVIYRRLNDAHIDPVVFSTDRETAGIPGLLQCIRAGRVALANTIGTGLAESQVIEAYLPRLAKFYLGEKLLLPAPETYACGEPDRLEQILDQHERFVIRPAHESPDNYTVTRPAHRRPLLTSAGLDRRVLRNPHAYVAQATPEALALDGRRPGGRTAAVPFCLSTFVLTDDRRQDVFPGGLIHLGSAVPPAGRVGAAADALVLLGSHNSGGIADLEAHDPGDSLHPAQLGSRAAESLFWLGRYLERAEATARMLAILDDVALEEIPARDRRHWLPVWRGLLEATGHSGPRLDARARPHETFGADLAWRLTLDADTPGSITAAVSSVLYNASQLRDYLSPETWRVLTRLHTRLEALRHRTLPTGIAAAKLRQRLANEAGQVVLDHVPAFHATADHTMLHDAAWHFLRLGVFLERAIMTCSALRHILGAHARPGHPRPGHYRDNPELSALLRMLGSQDAYRRVYQARSQPRYVAEFFLQQPDAPHGLFHLVHAMKQSLAAIRQESDPSSGPGAPERAAQELLLFLSELKPAPHFRGESDLPPLEKLLSGLLERLYALYPVFNDHHFSHQARLVPAEDQPELGLV